MDEQAFFHQGLGDEDVDLWALAVCERALPGKFLLPHFNVIAELGKKKSF